MKKPLLSPLGFWSIAAVMVLAAINSPWIIEGSENNCAAIEHLAWRETALKHAKSDEVHGVALAGAFIGSLNGRYGAAIAAERYPSLPAPIACIAGYWQIRKNMGTNMPR